MKYRKKMLSIIMVLVVVASILPYNTLMKAGAAESEPYVVSLGRMVYASSFKDSNYAENAVDGSLSTRWESGWQADPQWFYVDLGKVTQVTGIKIDWKGAYAKEYKIQFSNDEENWQDVYAVTSGKGGKETIDILGDTRYVRIYMTKRALSAYGYSFNEFEIYGLDGLTKRPEDYGDNIALNKQVTVSGIRITDSMYDDEGNLDDSKVAGSNAVDGNLSSKWVSPYSDDQWICVDLGQEYQVGRVVINWTSDSGKIYDIQFSEDGENWSIAYRQLYGYAEETSNVEVYEKARYLRIYGYTRVNTGNGFNISELQVYKYRDGDKKVSHEIEKLPEMEVKNPREGNGSYVTSAMYLEKAKLPVYKTEDVKVPIATNDWWQSAIMQRFGNLMCIMPLKAKYSAKGLEILTGTSGWLPTPGETSLNFSVKSETMTDIYVLPENMDSSKAYDRVSGNGDYSVSIQLCDDSGALMTSTFVKGCPYIFSEFEKTTVLYLSIPNLVKIYDDSEKEILKDTDTIITDHIGIMVRDNDNKNKEYSSESFYCLNFPEGTVLKNAGGKIKVTLPEENGYMSVGAMTCERDLETFYRHGYGFVEDTKVSYVYNEDDAVVNTYYQAVIKQKREGFDNTTMQCLLPHQWKKSADADKNTGIYTSVRGDLKCIVSNEFSTSDTFAGILPIFAMPDNKEFSTEKAKEYLNTLESATSKLSPTSDAYWEGKNIHPLAMGVLMADQLGDTKLRDIFLERLKSILVNWFHYDGKEDKSFFIYDEHWGTLYYKQSEFGANTSIADHHFTYGYFMFGASVLSNYDSEFYNEYKGMIELLARDYANDSDEDDMFCRFRNYDMYEGHSWAGGYANNDSGNNQESASEALFSWVGMYLWGVVSGNDKYRDAGVFGFTNEIQAVKQYWFNYDGDNWIFDWPYQVVSQVYGGTNFYGTFFGGQPLYCYGIQWLPVGEYLTSYGMEQDRAIEIYQGLLNDTETAIRKSQLSAANSGKTQEEIDEIPKNYKTPDNGWQHVTWSYLSMTNPDLAIDKFVKNDLDVQKTDQANTYWYINSMKESGHKTLNKYATGDISATVYFNEKTGKYTSMAWNPTSKSKMVHYKDDGKEIGKAAIAPHSLVKFELPDTVGFELKQTEAPIINVNGFYDNSREENIKGQVTYDDNKYIEIVSSDSDAVIYYTMDGSTPTEASLVYSEPILVYDNTVIKAFAVKEGEIGSSYASIDITIDGTPITGSENIARGKTVVTSSEEGNKTLGAYITDGDEDTRWSSKFTDNEWCYVDLGQSYPINKVVINWQNSYGKQYEIQVSDDGQNWSSVSVVHNSSLGEKITTFDAVNARYVKMQGIMRASVYGYSMWEMEVYSANVADVPQIEIEKLSDTKKKVTMSTDVKGAVMKYTTDGTEPSFASDTYTAPLYFESTKVIKAVTYRRGMMLSSVVIMPVLFGNSMILSENDITVTKGYGKQLYAYIEEGKALVWSSEDEDIATVSRDGIVTGVSSGKTNIIVKCGDITQTCKVQVKEPIHLEEIKLSLNNMAMVIGDIRELMVSYFPEESIDDRTVTWSSSDENVVKIENGKVVAISSGKAVITAKVGKLTDKCEVTVSVPPALKPAMPPGLVVKNPSNNTITVVWGRVSGCTYNVYIDEVCVDYGTGCYSHTYSDISTGNHTVSVTSVNESGIESDPNSKVITVLGEESTSDDVKETTTIVETVTTPAVTKETTKIPESSTQISETTSEVCETTTKQTVTESTSMPESDTTGNDSEESTREINTSKDITSIHQTTVAESSSLSEETKYTEQQTTHPKISIKKIKAGRTSIKKALKKKPWKKAKILLKKVSGVSGYQIKVFLNKKSKGKKAKIRTFKRYKFTVKNLKRNRQYYVIARAYKVVNKKKYFGKWSKLKEMK